MKCVPMRPRVLAPQTKKLPPSSQKSRERIASPSASNAAVNGLARGIATSAKSLRRAIGLDADVGGLVAQEQHHRRNRDDHRDAGDRHRPAPAEVTATLARVGKKIRLPAAALPVSRPMTRPRRFDEPAVRHHRRQDHRGDAGAEPDEYAPQRKQLPDGGDEYRRHEAEQQEAQRHQHDGAHAETVDECRPKTGRQCRRPEGRWRSAAKCRRGSSRTRPRIGTISTPGAPRTPDATSNTRKVTPTTIQP